MNLVSDIIACPGLDYCALANARAISVAQQIAEKFADEDRAEKVGELKVKISGCINACGHHHVGHIGILGVDKKGEEFYQLTLGGSGAEDAAVGQALGPAAALRPGGRGGGHHRRDLSARTPGNRAVPRHLPAHRRGPVQGGRLCRRSLA